MNEEKTIDDYLDGLIEFIYILEEPCLYDGNKAEQPFTF